MLVFSGGTGTPKLLLGLKSLLSPKDLAIVVNTAEDSWISGNLVSPDLDTVLYTMAGLIGEERWWGIKGDTFVAHDFLQALGQTEILTLGDRDRAVHIFRSNLLREGKTLCAATKDLANALGVKQKIVPMTDDQVCTMITTQEGEMPFQEFWVGRKGKPEVLSLRLGGIETARPSPGFIDLLEDESVILIGPSNPVTSIGPILALPEVRSLLKEKFVLAISPFVGDRPVSGPAAKFMQACGLPASDYGVISRVGPVDRFVVDKASSYSGNCVRLDTLMNSQEESIRLAKSILEILPCS